MGMHELLKEIILDYQETVFPESIRRRCAVTQVEGKATVCMGVRRSGKSTFLHQLIQRLLASGIARTNILYLNFFDDRLHPLQHENLGIISEVYFSLYPEKKNTEKIYCFFDEIQVIPGWELFIDRIMRTEICEVYITGSSAQMLSKEIATQMRGRSLSWEMFPFSFREFLDFKGMSEIGTITARKRFTIQKAFEEYWLTGGFPEVAGADQHLRIRIHQEYFNAMLFRDLVERHDIAHPRAIKDLALWMVDNISSLYSVNSLTGYLKSMGHKVPKAVVSDYMNWFEDAYIFFTVRIFDASLARANTNPKKIYCIDHSLVCSISSGILINSGHLLENLVFIAIRRVTPDIWYYKTKSGLEVDFVAQQQDRSRMLVQVCDSMADPKTRKREIAALSEAMSELGLTEGTIVTRKDDENILDKDRTINVVPVWRFLLNLPEAVEFTPGDSL